MPLTQSGKTTGNRHKKRARRIADKFTVIEVYQSLMRSRVLNPKEFEDLIVAAITIISDELPGSTSDPNFDYNDYRKIALLLWKASRRKK